MKILRNISAILMLLGGMMSASALQVDKITSLESLASYRDLFFQFGHAFCSQGIGQTQDEFLTSLFDQEEKDFAAQRDDVLFFGATLEDQAIGYLSCDVGLEGSVIVRQIAFVPAMYDADLIKELLFAIFANMPKVKHVSISCPIHCYDMALLFEDLGFTKLTGSAGNVAGSGFVEYELIVHPKCKICELLYPDSYWETLEMGDGYEDVWGWGNHEIKPDQQRTDDWTTMDPKESAEDGPSLDDEEFSGGMSSL